MFIVSLKKSVIITYIGVIFGVFAMVFAFTKMAFVEEEYIRYSLICLIFAGICDMFDGKIARMCKRTDQEKEFGIQIDSLADTVNFVVLPVVIMLALGVVSPLATIVYILFIGCGISRLALFNCNADADGPVKFYNGLPVTSVAIIYPLLGLLHGRISDYIFNNVYLAATAIIAFLFIANIKIPKMKHFSWYIILPIIGVIVSIILLVV